VIDVAVAAPRANALLEWLRFDPERIPKVEAAYDDFIRRSRFGVFFACAFVLAFVAIVIVYTMMPGTTVAQRTPAMFVVFGVIFYGGQSLALLLVPRETLKTMLVGAIDPIRGPVFGVACGVGFALLELAVVSALLALHVKYPKEPDLFGGGVLFGLLVALILAPIVEEFQMQAWLQTRLRGWGGVWAGIGTTIAFVLMHFPRSPLDFVRTFVLGGVAVTRGTTRSMGASIAMHLGNNLIIVVLVLLARIFSHK
jgi:membrane protease YdiL (CAAX protease family)